MLIVHTAHAKPPQGGHRFPQGDTVLRSDNVPDLLDKMELFRAANGLKLGDPQDDLALYYLKIAPFLVKRHEINQPPDRAKDSIAVSESIMRYWRKHPETLADDHPFIDLRRKKCEECPINKKFPVHEGKYRVYFNLSHQRAQLMAKDRDFDIHGLCSWNWTPVDLFIRLKDPVKYIEEEELPEVPKPCWVEKP